jgi:hypothetical protein
LSETGEARVRGYLFILGRSLGSFLPKDVARDALREVEGHILERAAESEATPSETEALERILAELGPPLRVAQAYAAELSVEEALVTGGVRRVFEAVFHLSMRTLSGFAALLGIVMGYLLGVVFLVLAVLKPIFPDNVGLITEGGRFEALGARFPVPPGAEVHGGYWIIPLSVLLGLVTILLTHRLARIFLERFRAGKGRWQLNLVRRIE